MTNDEFPNDETEDGQCLFRGDWRDVGALEPPRSGGLTEEIAGLSAFGALGGAGVGPALCEFGGGIGRLRYRRIVREASLPKARADWREGIVAGLGAAAKIGGCGVRRTFLAMGLRWGCRPGEPEPVRLRLSGDGVGFARNASCRRGCQLVSGEIIDVKFCGWR